jgi:hypothetical protein
MAMVFVFSQWRKIVPTFLDGAISFQISDQQKRSF